MTYIAAVDKFIAKKMGKGARDHLGESSALTVIGICINFTLSSNGKYQCIFRMISCFKERTYLTETIKDQCG